MTESDNFEDGNRDESAIVFGQEGEKGEKKGTITNRQMAIFHVELFGICSLDSSLLVWRLSGYLIEQQVRCKSAHKWRSKIDSTVAVVHFKICQIARARRRNEIQIPRIPTAAFPPLK